MKEKKTRNEIKKIIEGLTYHCAELATVMKDTVEDPYFETTEGRKIKKYCVGIMTNHLGALTEMMCPSNDGEGDKNSDVLNSLFEGML